MQVANRRDNGLVPLSHGGRKVAPIEIQVSNLVFSLILGSFENPMGSVDAQWIVEVAADLHKKVMTDNRYRWFRQHYLQLNNSSLLKMINHPKAKLSRKANQTGFQYLEITSHEQTQIHSILRLGGF